MKYTRPPIYFWKVIAYQIFSLFYPLQKYLNVYNDCCSFKQTAPNAANTGGGSNTTNQGATATTSSSPTTGTLQVSLDNPNSVSATYAVTVTGNNPQPSSFSISATSPQFVKLGPGSFSVSIDTSVPHSFSGDCKGTMSAGELQSCTIHITGPSQ